MEMSILENENIVAYVSILSGPISCRFTEKSVIKTTPLKIVCIQKRKLNNPKSNQFINS